MKNTIPHIAIIIPYYNASAFIESVLAKANRYTNTIIVVDDCSTEKIPQKVKEQFPTVVFLQTPNNLGVGGAMKVGFQYAIKLPDIKTIIKLDADDQMDTAFIPNLVEAVSIENFSFAKGNRFRDFKALRNMPSARRFGNLILSFLSKMATGYWNTFDFNNGFFAISKSYLKEIDFNTLANNYFFETSLIAELYHQKASIKEIAMPAIYGDEKSNMKIYKMPWLFAVKLTKSFFKRIWKAYFVYDFNLGTLYLITGLPLFTAGIIYGGYYWYIHSLEDQLTPVGTVMISAILIILGFQLLLQAVQFDVIKTPKSYSTN